MLLFSHRRRSMFVAWLLLFDVSSHLQQQQQGYFLVQAQEASACSPTDPLSHTSTCFNHQLRHLIVLVHGYKGSDKELSYLGQVLENITSTSPDINNANANANANPSSSHHHYTIYSSAANMGKTHDGIAAGGLRLAAEIEQQLQTRRDENGGEYHTLSIVGNSLGGMYARYALSELNLNGVQPIVFCTTSTPHLGNTQNTFIKLPTFLEWLIGKYVMVGGTGEDLFHLTRTVPDMCTLPQFLQPLAKFRQRIAVANAYGTDFLVPVSTAAFLSNSSHVPHHRVMESSSSGSMPLRYEVLQVTTPEQDPTNRHTNDPGTVDLGASLDALGWTKIFVDIRHVLPNYLQLNVPILSSKKSEQAVEVFSSQQLLDLLDRKGTLLPLGHPIMMANCRTSWYGWMTSNGRPIMDDLAKRLVFDIERLSQEMQEEKREEEVINI